MADGDSYEELTELLHRAYAPLAAQGMRFLATHQSVDVTRRRASRGECWVAVQDGRLVGTITVMPPGTSSSCDWYRRPAVASFGQMGVDPDQKGTGVGARLLDLAVERARALGASELALDTSVHARELHRTYARRGFRYVGPADWRPDVNYASVLMSKDLRGAIPGAAPPGWDRAPGDAWRDRPDRVEAVLGAVWPGLPAKLARAEQLGIRWREVSTACLADDAAHVGVIEFAAVLGGAPRFVAGVHAVGTAPEARGRGSGRRALERALRLVDERVATAVLTTAIPSYFAPFGFRVVPEHRFRVRRPLATGTGPALRPLSADRPEDVARVREALARRRRVSDRLAVVERGWFFVIDEVLATGGFGTVHAADDLGVLVAWRRTGDRAELLDVIGPEMPPLAEIAARLPAGLAGVDVCFCPDRLDVDTEAVPGAPDDTVLMVRGEWPLEGPVVLPVHARC